MYAEQFEVTEQVQPDSSRAEDGNGPDEYSTATAQHMADVEHAYHASYHNLRIIQQKYLKTAQNYHALHRQYYDLYQDSQHDRKKLELQRKLILELEAVIEVYRTGCLSIPSGSNRGANTSGSGVAMPALTTIAPRLPHTVPTMEPVSYKAGDSMGAGPIQNDPGYLAVAGSRYAQGPISSIQGTPSPPKSPAKYKTNAGVSKRGRKNGKQRQQSLEVLAASRIPAPE